jgi:hypothetical protein
VSSPSSERPGRPPRLLRKDETEPDAIVYREIQRTFEDERGTAPLHRLQSLRPGVALLAEPNVRDALLAWLGRARKSTTLK